ncbi:MAG: rhomboid family intramembrane serine protease [Bacteroidota bacterium]|nr:rhomboid family intramembrane serine protease [Bacteroidota bacterium]
MQITETVKQLIIINIIFFVGSLFVAQANAYLPMFYFENPQFGFWQPLTSMFMHGGLTHILFNMFGLFMFGSLLERFWGGKKFLFYYISCGLGASLLHQVFNYIEFHSAHDALTNLGVTPTEIQSLLQFGSTQTSVSLTSEIQQSVNTLYKAFNTPVVGASGAIYGILVAFAYMFPEEKLMFFLIPIAIKAKFFVPGLLLIDLISGLNGGAFLGQSTGIAHFAHLGGAITGFIILVNWKKNQFKGSRWD